jgi:hypothetical protein
VANDDTNEEPPDGEKEDTKRAEIRARVEQAEKDLQQPKDTANSVKAPRPRKSGKVAPNYSERALKFYNVEEAELFALTALDLVASLLLAFSMAFVAFYFGANWDLLLASGLPEKVLAEAKAARTAAGWAALGLLGLTALAIVARFVVTNHITKTSSFVNIRQ